MSTLRHLWTNHIISEHIILSNNTSYHPWPNGIIDEHNISSRITSCRLRMKRSIYAHIITVIHGLYHPRAHHSSMNTTWHYTMRQMDSFLGRGFIYKVERKTCSYASSFITRQMEYIAAADISSWEEDMQLCFQLHNTSDGVHCSSWYIKLRGRHTAILPAS